MVVRKALRSSVPLSALPAFTPVPRKIPRHDGWTPARQRAFIEALADTGCVAIAARMVNMSQPSVYQLRRQPGAESFRAAMDAAQTLGLQPVKDEAFDRAMNGQLVPVFVGGKLLGFRRKKNDRLLMFILRHYGQDAGGRKTTVNYFSTRASTGAASPSPLGGEGDSRSERGEGESGSSMVAAPSAMASAKAEASTTTVKTVISGPGAHTQLDADESAANVLNAFEGAQLDAEAQAEIYRTLEACAERRRALEADPANDPERIYLSPEEARAGLYAGELESGVEGDWVEYRPEGEHRWEGLGEGGEAQRIDEVLAGMEERKRLAAPEIAPPPDPPDEGGSAPESMLASSPFAHPEAPPSDVEGVLEGPISPRTGKPLKRYRKRQPKPPFTSPGEERKAEAVAAVAAERRVGAAAEAERRRRKGGVVKE